MKLSKAISLALACVGSDAAVAQLRGGNGAVADDRTRVLREDATKMAVTTRLAGEGATDLQGRHLQDNVCANTHEEIVDFFHALFARDGGSNSDGYNAYQKGDPTWCTTYIWGEGSFEQWDEGADPNPTGNMGMICRKVDIPLFDFSGSCALDISGEFAQWGYFFVATNGIFTPAAITTNPLQLNEDVWDLTGPLPCLADIECLGYEHEASEDGSRENWLDVLNPWLRSPRLTLDPYHREPPSDAIFFLACGNSGNAACETPPSPTWAGEVHAVRCCSDADLGAGWIKYATCDVWAESDIGGQCHASETFASAENKCASVGARLCTKDEVAADCTRGTGCQFDQEMIWTSTPAESVMQVFVKARTGQPIALDVMPSDTIYDVKKMIQDWLQPLLPSWISIGPGKQQLIFAGQTLENSRTLSSYNIQEDSTIQLELLLW